MKNTSRIGNGFLKLFAVISMTAAASIAFSGDARPQTSIEIGSVETVLNIVMPDGRIMLYRPDELGILENNTYDVLYGGNNVGKINVGRIFKDYAMVDYAGLMDKRELEGQSVLLQGNLAITRRPFPQVGAGPPVALRKTLQPGDAPAPPAPAQTAPEADSAKKKIDDKPPPRTEEKKEPAKKKTSTASARKPSRASKSGSKDVESSDGPSGDSSGDASTSKSSRSSRSRSSRGGSGEPSELEITTGSESGGGKEMSVETPFTPGPPILSYMVRLDTHSDERMPDTTMTAVISSTKRMKSYVQTAYVMHSANFNDENNTPDSTGFGLSYAYFFPNAWYAMASYNYQIRKERNNIPDFKEDSDALLFGLYRMFGLTASKDQYYRAYVTYNTSSDLDSDQSYSAGLSYFTRMHDQRSLTLSYKYTYSFDLSDQLYDQYGADYTIPMSKGRRVTLGYRLTNREYGNTGSGSDDDQNFRLVFYATK